MKWGYVIGIIGLIIIAMGFYMDMNIDPLKQPKYQTSVYVYRHNDGKGTIFYLNADQEHLYSIATTVTIVGFCIAGLGCAVEIIRLKPWRNGWG